MARGHVRKRGNKWCAEIFIGIDENGKRKRIYISQDTKKAAEAEAAKIISEINAGGFIEPSNETFGDYLERWLESTSATVRPTTVRGYTSMIRKHFIPALGHIPLAKLRPIDLQQYYATALKKGRKDGRGTSLSPQTVLHHHRLIHRTLEQAVKWGLLARNVADAAEPPRVPEYNHQTWTADESNRFLRGIRDERLYALYATALMTGMRRGEVLGLPWENVDLDGAWISVRQALIEIKHQPVISELKSKSSKRRISIPDELVRSLRTHRKQQAEERLLFGPDYEDHGLVFCQPNGRLLHPHNISARKFHRLCKKAGVKQLRFHDMRHTHASLLLARGVHPKVVADRLGHSNVDLTLNTYSHVVESVERDVAKEVDGLFSQEKEAL